jgi:hypothetical protein
MSDLQIAAADSMGEKPTPRAITEHFKTLKAKAAAIGGGSSNNTPKRPKTSIPIRAAPVTPRKRPAPKASSGSGTKRQRKTSDIESDGDSSPAAAPTPRTSRPRRAASEHVAELIRQAYASDSNEPNGEEEEEEIEEDYENGEFQEERGPEKDQKQGHEQVPDLKEPGDHNPGEVEAMLDEAVERHQEEPIVKIELDMFEEA